MRKDENGRTYYVDHISKKTQWNPPDPGTLATSELVTNFHLNSIIQVL